MRDYDRRHYHFERVHKSSAPFVQPKRADTLAEAIVGVVALVALLGVGLLLSGW